MAEFSERLSKKHRAFVEAQHVFFVATAPGAGRINLSPKGMDTFRCIDDRTVGYLDLTGSGNETSAHLEENGRVTLMFCGFTARPLILRIYGRGRAVRPQDAAWEEYLAHFRPLPGQRQIIVVEVEAVQTSCGYAVPYFEYGGERETLVAWAAKKGEGGVRRYQEKENITSIDGLETGLFKPAADAEKDER